MRYVTTPTNHVKVICDHKPPCKDELDHTNTETYILRMKLLEVL